MGRHDFLDGAVMADPLGAQCEYALQVVDGKGYAISTEEFGMNALIAFRMPPQALQIERTIRADVLKDISRGVTIVQGGEGLGRIVIQGTHGVGPLVDLSQPSSGRDARESIVAFFQAFVNANDLRGANGQPGLQMVFMMVNGSWSNPESEGYFVWPDSFPKDSRSAARPHAWDWSLSMILLGTVAIRVPADHLAVQNPAQLAKKLEGLAGKIQLAMDGYKRYKKTMQSLKDLKNSMAAIKDRIQSFRTGALDEIYEITDLVRGSAQIGRQIMQSMDLSTFNNDVENAIRGAVYEARELGGQAIIQAHQFRRSGAIQDALTAGNSSNVTRPSSVGVSAGDTPQSIAAKHLDSSSDWTDLVKVNGLVYPYFDFSGPGGRPGAEYAGMAVLGAADSIKLPLPASSGVAALSSDPIGTDYADVPAGPGALLGGIENLQAALVRRLVTPVGRIPWQPDYGSNLDAFVGSTQELRSIIGARREVIRVLKSDPRVTSIESVEVSVSGAAVSVEVMVKTPLGLLSVTT